MALLWYLRGAKTHIYKKKMETVLSGIRPTGNLHLGNYYGAVTSFIKLQDLYRCFFFIADWHSLTIALRINSAIGLRQMLP